MNHDSELRHGEGQISRPARKGAEKDTYALSDAKHTSFLATFLCRN